MFRLLSVFNDDLVPLGLGHTTSFVVRHSANYILELGRIHRLGFSAGLCGKGWLRVFRHRLAQVSYRLLLRFGNAWLHLRS